MQFMSTLGIGVAAGIKCAVYGKAGRGKTRLALTCPAPAILSAESGLLSLASVALPYKIIKTVGDLQEALTYFATNQNARQFRTIYIDSVTEIAEVVLANAKGQVKDPRQAYGELIEKMMMVIKGFRDLHGYNVVMTAKQEFVKDEATGLVMNMASFPGSKLGQQFPYLFDEVFQLDIGQNPDGSQYTFLRTAPDFQNDAKDRSGALAPIEEPHLGKIFDKINRMHQPQQQQMQAQR